MNSSVARSGLVSNFAVDGIRGALVALMLGGSVLVSTPALAQSAASYRALGLEYRAAGQLSDSIAAFRKAVELAPNHLDGRVNLGWTLHLVGDDRAAAEVLQANVLMDPFHVPSLNALGIVYLVNEDLPGAVLTHTWAAWLQPNNEVAHYNLSLAFQRAEHYDWAITNAEKAAELEPSNPHPLVALAIADWAQGHTEEAQQTYQQAIDLDSRYADRAFLDYLNEAGFNAQQIEISKQILASL